MLMAQAVTIIPTSPTNLIIDIQIKQLQIKMWSIMAIYSALIKNKQFRKRCQQYKQKITIIFSIALNNFYRQYNQMKQTYIRTTNQHSSQKSFAFSLHSCADNTTSQSFSRKMSTSSLKDYVDIDKVIGDIKITPAKTEFSENPIKNIMNNLEKLKNNQLIVDEVRTIQLLLETISKKISAQVSNGIKSKHQSINKEQQNSNYKNSGISPIKMFQDASSRILYTNFSLKDIENEKISINQDKNIFTPMKRSQKVDLQQDDQMQKLNNQIQVLQKMLKKKGIDNSEMQKKINTGPASISAKPFMSFNQAKQNQPVISAYKKLTTQTKQVASGPSTLNGNALYDRSSIRRASQSKFH